MRLTSKTATWSAIAVLIAVALGAGIWYGLDWLAKKPDVDVVNRYLGAYKDPDLKTVKSLVSSDMAESLPASQSVFAQAVEQSANGQIESWKITKVERNKWVGQSVITVDVTTTKKTFNVAFDVFNLPEGRLIRAVSDLDIPVASDENQNSSSSMMNMMMSTGTTSTGSAH